MRSYAQFGEDIQVADLLARIGVVHRVAVDIGAGDGVTASNTARLRKAGWRVLLYDVEPKSDLVIKMRATARNINTILAGADVPEDFDLLSIDIDGQDYWLWRAVRWQPRLVIIEYNARLGLTERVTVQNRPDHDWDHTRYFGASAPALVALGHRKGYDLVGGTPANLLFARAGLDDPMPLSALPVPCLRKKQIDVKQRPWVAV